MHVETWISSPPYYKRSLVDKKSLSKTCSPINLPFFPNFSLPKTEHLMTWLLLAPFKKNLNKRCPSHRQLTIIAPSIHVKYVAVFCFDIHFQKPMWLFSSLPSLWEGWAKFTRIWWIEELIHNLLYETRF